MKYENLDNGILVVRIWEGLGNQMFQYAYAKRLQKESGIPVFLEGRRIYKNSLPGEDLVINRECDLINFNLKMKFIKPKYLEKWKFMERKNIFQILQFEMAKRGIGNYLFLTDEPNKFLYHEDLFNLHKNSYIMGHFLNRKYFEPLREELLHEFSLKNKVRISKKLEEAFAFYDTISLHIRRGDYLFVDFVQNTCKRMQKGKYYTRAMEYMASKQDNPLFLIFSDDIEWVKENFACPFKHLYVSDMGFSNCEEMIIMSYCKHNIIANSTFSFWGAWLNQNEKKEVIFPKYWLPSIIPKGWIPL